MNFKMSLMATFAGNGIPSRLDSAGAEVLLDGERTGGLSPVLGDPASFFTDLETACKTGGPSFV